MRAKRRFLEVSRGDKSAHHAEDQDSVMDLNFTIADLEARKQSSSSFKNGRKIVSSVAFYILVNYY